MKFSWKPSEKPLIRFDSMVEGLSKSAPPYRATSRFPYWFKNKGHVSAFDSGSKLEQASRFASTVRRCPGVVDFHRQGFVLPLWADFLIKYDSNQGIIDVTSATPWAHVEMHSIEQFSSTPIEAISSPYPAVIKLVSPWRVHLSQGYSSLMVDAVYEREWAGFSVLPGIIAHESFHASHIFLVWERYGRGECIISAGTPLAQLIPVKDEVFDLKVEETGSRAKYDETVEINRVSGWVGRYRRMRKTKRS